MDVVTLIAQAIGFAEGYGADPTNRPTRNNNPGDMTLDLIGKGVRKDGPFIVYATPEDGWSNLYAQIQELTQPEIQHADKLNIQGVRRSAYLNALSIGKEVVLDTSICIGDFCHRILSIEIGDL